MFTRYFAGKTNKPIKEKRTMQLEMYQFQIFCSKSKFVIIKQNGICINYNNSMNVFSKVNGRNHVDETKADFNHFFNTGTVKVALKDFFQGSNIHHRSQCIK